MVLPILLMLLFGIADFGRVFFTWLTVTNATREGARAGALGADTAAVEARVLATAGGIDTGPLDVVVTGAGGDPGTSVAVDSTYEVTLITPIAGIINYISGDTVPASITVTSSATMRIE